MYIKDEIQLDEKVSYPNIVGPILEGIWIITYESWAWIMFGSDSKFSVID